MKETMLNCFECQKWAINGVLMEFVKNQALLKYVEVARLWLQREGFFSEDEADSYYFYSKNKDQIVQRSQGTDKDYLKSRLSCTISFSHSHQAFCFKITCLKTVQL